MKPRITFTFTLLGVLLVGLSLHSLTTAPARVSEVKQAQTAPTEPIYATLRFTGQPLSLILRHGGKEWQVDTALQPAEIELELPRANRIDIEVEAHWAEEDFRCITLTLEPDGRESRSVTHWAENSSNTLHNVYTFTW